jgi:hypothetical protein
MEATFIRWLLLVLMIAGDFFWSPADAQVGRMGVLRVPCCKCVDGGSRTISLDTGTANWTVRRPTRSNSEPAVIVPSPNGSWANVAPARWIGPSGSKISEFEPGNYAYDLQLEIPTCLIPSKFSLTGRFAADNWAALLFDSRLVAKSSGPPNNGFTQPFVTSFSTNVSAGVYLLRLVVRNDDFVTGLALQGAVTVSCPRDPEAF